MKIVNSKQMVQIDQETQSLFKIPALLLMENAGQKIYTHINEHIWKKENTSKNCVFLVGKGNNGGDALVIARQCAIDGLNNITIILTNGKPASASLAFMQLKICEALQLLIIDYTKEQDRVYKVLAGSDYIIDGILGTGISDQVREPLQTLLNKINVCSAYKFAIDVPSGIGDNFKKGFIALKADYTFTVELPKQSLYLPYARPFCGIIHCIKIGFPPQPIRHSSLNGELLDSNNFFELLPVIPKHAHKSTRGHCAVFAGSIGTTGAAYLSTMAAARTRWGVDNDKLKILEKLIALDLPGVIDADGITLLAELVRKKRFVFKEKIILTPHPGEFIRLCGGTIEELLNDPLSKLLAISRQLHTPIILKGHISYLVSPSGDYWILDGMNPALATGGSGDVLAGIIAGFIAGGIDVLTAGKLGLLLHSKIGEYLYTQRGWFLAEDIIPVISQALSSAKENPIWQ